MAGSTEMGSDRLALVGDFDDLEGRVEVGAGLAVGTGAIGAHLPFEVGDLAGEAADREEGLGLQVLAA